MKKILLFIGISSIIGLSGCKKILEEKLYSQLGGENFLRTEAGINTVLNGAYNAMNPDPQTYAYKFFYSHISAGIGWGQGGAFEQTTAAPMQQFTWTPTQPHLASWWKTYYEGIRNCNIVIDYAAKGDFTDEFKNIKIAEAKALRGYFYYQLYELFGTAPLFINAGVDSLIKPRAKDDEMKAQIENDLKSAASVLPDKQDLYGKATKGGALGVLCKFYLNTKQWQKCADVAHDIIEMGIYHLVSDYRNIYSLTNKKNAEALWVVPNVSTPATESTNIIALLVPPDYPLFPGQISYAARNYVYDSFVNSFPTNDIRKTMIEPSYVNTSGTLIQGYGNNKSLYMKYPIDPSAAGDANGTDFIAVRYADILLSRAEALNELSGPTQESIDLINEVRDRAHADGLVLANFPAKETFRDAILSERLWEFYIEGMEREDMIRHGKFITAAIARGINAKEYQTLFPIPQVELDANEVLEQNEGYGH